VYRGDGSLDYILHPEGVVRATGQGLSPEYFLKDHLGSTRVVFNGNGAVLQATDYYAFGMEHTPKAKENENRYLYNGKELQDETFAGGVKLGWYDYGARFYDPEIGRWHVIDNKADKYYSWSPYVYAINDPVKFTDPDGNDIYIWYPGDDGKQTSFRFNGTNGASAPSNGYVQNVLKAYNYDVKNGGGDNLKEAATNPDIQVSVTESTVENGDYSTNINGFEYVFWNPNEGLLTEEGVVLSPATMLEHETDHAVNSAKNSEGNQKDSQYTTKEEKRVITGSEKKTGTANGEFKKGEQRKSHGGTTVEVNGTTSTKVNKEKTNANIKKMENAGYDMSEDKERLKKYVK